MRSDATSGCVSAVTRITPDAVVRMEGHPGLEFLYQGTSARFKVPAATWRRRLRRALWLSSLCVSTAVNAQTFTEGAAIAGVDVTGGDGGITWADYDGDGFLDLFAITSAPNPPLLHNNQDGTFTDLSGTAGISTGGGSVRGVSWGDYDGDGWLDLSAGRGGGNKLFRSDGDATFTESGAAAGVDDGGSSRGMAWVDYDGDELLDLFVVNDGTADRLFRNNGNATFTEVGGAAGVDDAQAGRGAAWADFDGDDDPDLYVVIDGAANRLYRNDGGTFTEIGAAAGVDDAGTANGLAWGDYDNDGQLDLLLGVDGANRLYHNNGATFADAAAAAGVDDAGSARGVAWADYDNDGFLDLFVGNDGTADRLYHGNGAGAFTEVGAAEGVDDTGAARGAAWGDIDNDGFLELCVVRDGAANLLYHNADNGNHWMVLDLVDADGRPAPIGTSITIVAGGIRQVRHVDGGSGYYSQPSLPLEFGLGAATSIDSLIIDWASGAEQVLTNVAPDQDPAIVEAQSSESTPAAGLTGETVVAPGSEIQIFSIGIDGNGAADLQGITLTLEDLSSATGLAQADLLQLRLYRSTDAALDGGDSQIGSVAQGSIQINAPTTLSPSATEVLPAIETFYLISAEITAQPGDGHSLRVGFAAGGVQTSAGPLGSAVPAADTDRVRVDVVATELTLPPPAQSSGEDPTVVGSDAQQGEADTGGEESLTEPSEPQIVYWVDLELETDSLDFGLVQPSRMVSRMVTLHNPGNDRLNVSSLRSSNAAYRTRAGSFSIDPGGTYDLWIDYRPYATRLDTATLTIGSGAPQLRHIFLNGRGVTAGHLTLGVDALDFGEVEVDSVCTMDLPLTNTGGDTLRIELQMPASDFSVTPLQAVLLPSQTLVAQVTFAPTSHTDSATRLTIIPDAAAEAVYLFMTGTGMCPYVRFDLNKDTMIDGTDLCLFTKYLNGEPVPTGLSLDFTGDGRLDEADLRVLANRVELRPLQWVVADSTGRAQLTAGRGLDLATPPLHGHVIMGATTVYVTDRGYTGIDVVGLTGADGARSLYLIQTHRPAHRAPVLASIGKLRVNEGEDLVVDLTPIDLDGDLVTISVVGLPGAIVQDGILRWTPGPGTAGRHRLMVRALDAHGFSDTGTYYVFVDPAGPLPEAGDPEDEAAVEDPVADDPVADDPVADDPVADDPVADDSVADDAAVDDHGEDNPSPPADPPMASRNKKSHRQPVYCGPYNPDCTGPVRKDDTGVSAIETESAVEGSLAEGPAAAGDGEDPGAVHTSAKEGSRAKEIATRFGMDDMPQSPRVLSSYPNPFNPETTLRYLLSNSTYTRVSIYNMLGQQIRIVHDGYESAGQHDHTWQGIDDGGVPVAAGIYFQVIETADFRDVQKLTLLR